MKTEEYNYKKNLLASLYEEYYDRVARYAFTRIGNRHEAEDIASDTFLKALESLSGYKDQGIPMQAWLFRIAHNLVVDYLRKSSKNKEMPIEMLKTVDDADPAATAEINIQMESVKEAMEQLTPDQREVLQLRFFGELTSREVSDIMHKTDGAVREMQRAALEKLRKILNDEC
jgi:RNA polymerase sigma-70 factor (ECF subfamily)